MSTLGGIYSLNGAPIDEHMLTALGNALAAHGPDGGREVCSTSVGMAFRAFHTNRDSRLEIQPLVSRNKHILAWDGRLDNRSELISILRDDLDEDRTDAAIVMAAYLKWGVDCLPRIIGDFALSLWDPRTRTLLLARDPVGTRTLFYCMDRDKLVWSSTLPSLLDLQGMNTEIDDEYVAGYLTTAPDPGLTPYKNIHAVLPGNVLLARGGQLQVRRYWSLNPQYEIRYKCDADYEERFRELFREAISCRLRTDQVVWSELSGGLDSSSIVCMADQLIRTGDLQTRGLETVSYVYDDSPTSDERAFITCVEEKIGKRGHHLREEDYRALAACEEEPLTTVPSFLHNFAKRHLRLCELMRESGGRVLLSGQGGDHLLWSCTEDSPELADLLLQCKLFRLHNSVRAWAQARKRSYLDLIWKAAVLPVLPRALRSMWQPDSRIPSWYDPEFAVRMKLRDRQLSPPDSFGFRLPSQQARASMFLRAVNFIAAGFYEDWGCIEVAYPYLHRPLVEFLQAIPFEQLLRPGETRSLHRRALRNLLPEKIAKRKGKRGPDEALYRALIREWPRLSKFFENACVCARGYAMPDSLREALERGRHGQERYSGLLMRTITLELWLRSLERQNSMCRGLIPPKHQRVRRVSQLSVETVASLGFPRCERRTV
jgi:asparagine synthase (glutamine-hydrolysing)